MAVAGAVSREEFEAGLAALAALPGSDAEGFFGPGSMLWAVGREATGFIGGGAAILLQTAHPWVAQAIADHSSAFADPIGRFHRTFRPVFAMVYGTRTQALAQARKVRAVHEHIHGTMSETLGRFPAGSPYMADDGEALFWVQATLWRASIAVREQLQGPLTQAQKDQYHEESKRFAALFGVPRSLLCESWAAFEARFDSIANSDMLAVGKAGHLICDELLGNVMPGWYRAVTAALLPPKIADAYGLKAPRDIDAIWERVAFVRRTVPPALRYIGPYREARYRLQGRGPGLLTQTLNRVWIGRPLLEPIAR